MKYSARVLTHRGGLQRPRGHWLLALVVASVPAVAGAASVEVVPGTGGAPGEVVSVAVMLRTQGEMVAATQNDLGFDRRNIPVVALPNDLPDCTVNPAIDKSAALFGFQPVGCGTSMPCSAVRAVVVSLDNLDPIPSGSVLYTCRVAIAAAAAAGTYPLSVSGVVLVDPDANALPGSQGVGGSIAVSEPTASCAGDCNGDGVVAVNELVIGVSIALGALPLDACPGFAGGDGSVDIADLVAAVNDALSGCQ